MTITHQLGITTNKGVFFNLHFTRIELKDNLIEIFFHDDSITIFSLHEFKLKFIYTFDMEIGGNRYELIK